MIMMMSLLLLFVSSTVLFYLFVSTTTRKKRIHNRIEAQLSPVPSEKEGDEGVTDRSSRKIVAALSKVFSGMQASEKTVKRLEQAGSTLKLEEYTIIRIVSATALVMALYVTGLPFLLSLITAPVGYMIPNFYMKRKAKKRVYLLSFQLVEALGTMSNSLRAGFSFTQTIQLIGTEMPDPIGPEFNRIIRELGLGIPMEEVFQNMLIRLPNKELEVVFQAILAQRQTGGNLAELLDTMEDTVRGRIKILDELKTLTAQGKISSWIITLLPILLGLYLYMSSPDYFGPMLHHPLGLTMLGVSGISILIGWLVIQKIIRIEV